MSQSAAWAWVVGFCGHQTDRQRSKQGCNCRAVCLPDAAIVKVLAVSRRPHHSNSRLVNV